MAGRLGQRIWRVATAGFVLVCGWWYWQRCWLAQMPDRGPSDFEFYYRAAQQVLHGRSPYLEGGYVYPPLLACLLAPLAAFDYFTARWIWFAISHAAFLGAGWLVWRHLGRGRAALCAVALVWAAGGAAEDGFGLGQADAVLVLLAVIALSGGGRAAAAGTAGGFALKLFPGILGVLPAMERRWRALVLAMAGAVLLTALPWAAVGLGLRGPAAPPRVAYLAGTPCLLSWSLPSAALRLLDHPGRRGPLPADWTLGYDLPKLRLRPAAAAVSLAVAGAVLAGGVFALWFAAGGAGTGHIRPLRRAPDTRGARARDEGAGAKGEWALAGERGTGGEQPELARTADTDAGGAPRALAREATQRPGKPELTPERRGLAGSGLLSLALAASPISWWHYPVLHYPALALLLAAAARDRRFGLLCGVLGTGAAVYRLPAAALRHYYRNGRWPDDPWALQFWTAVPALASLVLFAIVLFALAGGGQRACRIGDERTDAPL